MKVFILKDVEKVGMAGSIISVSDGYAQNFLIPRKLAVKITEKNLDFYKRKLKTSTVESKVLGSKAEMTAERIKNMHLVIKKRAHDGGKLYGKVSSDDVVELLKKKEISVNRKQIEFVKSIRSVGEHGVVVRLSSKLKPILTLKVLEKGR